MDINALFKDYRLKTGTVEAWGQTVHIKELSAADMDTMKDCKGNIEMYAMAVVLGVTNEDGKMAFSKSDKKKLLNMAATELLVVGTAVLKLSEADDNVEKT